MLAYIKKKMEEQSKRDTEEDDDNESGTKYIFLDSLTVSAVRYKNFSIFTFLFFYLFFAVV